MGNTVWDDWKTVRGALDTEIAAPRSTPAEARRFDELDAYRGLAALAIVVFHAYQFSRQATHQPTYLYEGGALHHLFGNLEAGVAWFFTLSGFLLFLPIAAGAIRQSRPFSPRGFLIRRAIRILPLYFAAIVVVWSWRYSGGWEQWLDLLRHLTFTHSFDSAHIFWTIGPAWSLAVEAHFYLGLALVAPVLYRLCGRCRSERARIAALAGAIGAFALAGAGYTWWVAFVADVPKSSSAYYYSFPAKIDQFAIGMALALVAAATGSRQLAGRLGAAALRIWGVAMLALLFAARHVDSVPGPLTPFEVYFQDLSALAFGGIVAAAVFGPARSLWSWLFLRRSLLYVGLVSYGVYLWHEPILIELGMRGRLISAAPGAFPRNVVLLVILSIAAGAASYAVIELPVMGLRRRLTYDGRLKPVLNRRPWEHVLVNEYRPIAPAGARAAERMESAISPPARPGGAPASD